MDCNMPFMDGYQSTREIRRWVEEHNHHQPYIVAVTGHSEEEYRKIAKEAGMNDLVVKPADVKRV